MGARWLDNVECRRLPDVNMHIRRSMLNAKQRHPNRSPIPPVKPYTPYSKYISGLDTYPGLLKNTFESPHARTHVAKAQNLTIKSRRHKSHRASQPGDHAIQRARRD